ncbi:MAG: tRNA pseudouridine synthase A, partial [Bacteroidetes bacterium]|nr:tRNA pseudouridine synthase A [Bacteroidota bacterium]
SRRYKYRISRQKDPFTTDTCLLFTGPLNIGEMNMAAVILRDYTDFASFCRADSDVKTTICKVSEAFWYDHGHLLEFTISADRFLRNMVRAVAGTMLDVGKERISVEDFRKIIEMADRKAAGQSAPAHGLSLTGIEYPANIFTD